MTWTVCNDPTCPELTQNAYCPTHAPKPWASSNRSQRTISGSKQQARAARVLRSHNGICHICGQPGADQADHVIPLAEDGPDTEANMRPIHSEPCHRQKTQAEAARARVG